MRKFVRNFKERLDGPFKYKGYTGAFYGTNFATHQNSIYIPGVADGALLNCRGKQWAIYYENSINPILAGME